MMEIFRYDFGYAWPWTYGHLIAAGVCAGVVALCRIRRVPAWIAGTFVVLGLWAVCGSLIVNGLMRFSLPVPLPTERFLATGEGRVLDVGAGSGRSTLMVLTARPKARVVALDRYTGYYGIVDNTPERLLANARVAGVDARVETVVGDMREMRLPDRSFDAVVSVAAIDHLRRADVGRTLAEVSRVLKPDGEFLLMVVNPDIWVQIALPFLQAHGYFGGRGQPERWRKELQTAGFTVVEEGTKPATLFFLARAKKSSTAPGSSADGV
jgi:ubiquinone/menaquinone biosynthesis C-methylase UbiE